MERTIGASPCVGGLRGSVMADGPPNGAANDWPNDANGCPNEENGSLGNMPARGEKRLSPGVGGHSTKRMLGTSWSVCKGFFVIVSTRGDIRGSSSSGKPPGIDIILSTGSWLKEIDLRKDRSLSLGKDKAWKPNDDGDANPGEGGGFEDRSRDGGGANFGAGARAGARASVWEESPWPDFGRAGIPANLNGARCSSVCCSTSSCQAQRGGADAGPGVTG